MDFPPTLFEPEQRAAVLRQLAADDLRVRYIKLGNGGEWADECVRGSKLRLGFWTHLPEIISAAKVSDWDAVAEVLRRCKNKAADDSVADAVRQVRAVFEDDGSTLWVTFHRRTMFWGFLDPDVAPEAVNGNGSVHTLRKPGWSWQTLDEPGAQGLHRDDLAGHLGQVTQYRGTICEPAKPAYVRDRILGVDSGLSVTAAGAIGALEVSIAAMLKDLTPFDFETAVDMAFRSAGWRRESPLGGVEEDVDLVLVRHGIPHRSGARDERIAVQVKSQATQRVFESCADKLLSSYTQAFFAYHSGDIQNTRPDRVVLLDAAALAPMVLDAGMVRWLVRRCR